MRGSRVRARWLDERLPVRAVLDAAADAMVAVDATGCIVYVNPALTDLLGHRPHDLIGERLDILIPARFRPTHDGHVEGFRHSGLARQIGRRPLLRALAHDGSERAVSVTVFNLKVGDALLTIAAVRDATPVDVLLERAIERSQTDALTGIANRTRLIEQMQQRIDGRRPFGLLFLDLTGFKQFNDTHGHLAGDEVLRIVARRLQAVVRAGDLAVRWAGDEFVLLLDTLTELPALAQRARLLAEHVAEPFALAGGQARVAASIGGARFPADGGSVDRLLAVADGAMYRAKARGAAFDGPPAAADAAAR